MPLPYFVAVSEKLGKNEFLAALKSFIYEDFLPFLNHFVSESLIKSSK
jgi:hypothetical protein